MKYKIIYLILIFIYLLCGCSKNTDSISMDSEVSTVLSKKEDIITNEYSSKEDSSENKTSVIEKEDVNSFEVKNESQVSNAEHPKKENSDLSSSEMVSVNSNTDKSSQNTEIESTPSSSVPVQVTKPNATKDDTKIIAEKMVEYINRYREEQGSPKATILPGLTMYAEYRSRQLVSSFAHNTFDERAAATALKYGEYIDPQKFGSTGEPYYRANAREAILMAGYVGTVDDVAEKLALLAKNSAGHWNYVGSEEYKYIAIGVTYESGMWYADIAVSIVNYDN